MRLADKVAIITGAGGGMGRVASQMFAAEGAKIWLATRPMPPPAPVMIATLSARRIESS